MKTRPLLRWSIRLLVGLVLVGTGAMLVVASGIVPIGASSGHWPITAWFLHFAMKRSVATHSTGIKAPSLDAPGLVLKGAGHYHSACRPCHGSPELPHPVVPAAMTPHPPYLPEVMSDYDPEELFYLVKHGVKFTGMPAFPTQQRDDEVWAVVAFLREFPALDADSYRELAIGSADNIAGEPALEALSESPEPPAAIRQSCARCHGWDGRGRGQHAFPVLTGQNSDYLAKALLAYAAGERHSGIMQPFAAGLNSTQAQQLADYYAGQDTARGEELPALPSAAPPGMLERGQAIAREGIPADKVPACASCHGLTDGSSNPSYPHLAGQQADYLMLQLKLFQERRRGGSPHAPLMYNVADPLSEEALEAVARYYASLPLPRGE